MLSIALSEKLVWRAIGHTVEVGLSQEMGFGRVKGLYRCLAQRQSALTVDNHLEATIWTNEILVCVHVPVSVCTCV